MHSLWRFRPSLIQEQADRRSTWVLGCCIPQSSLADVITLQTFILEILTTLDNIFASCRWFKGGAVCVAHERGATYAEVQRRPGSRTGFKHYAIAPGFRMAVLGCTKSNFGFVERGKKSYSVCVSLGFSYCVIGPTIQASQFITDIETFPRIRFLLWFHLLIYGFSMGSWSPADLSKLPSNYCFFPVSEYYFLSSREPKSLLLGLRDLRTHLSSPLLYIHCQ